MGRFINADAFASTGESLLDFNMFAYCANNPITSYDPKGESPVSQLELWDYYIIHKLVQFSCVAENNWDMEVYVKGPLGKGFLDLFDAETNTYYEVKSKRAFERGDAITQMLKYDNSIISAKRYKNANIAASPSRGTEIVAGSFTYGIWDIHYYTQENGLIIYEPTRNEGRSIQVALALIVVGLIAAGQYEAAVGVGTYAAAY